MSRSGADLVNVDHLVDFRRACAVYGGAGICFKGNLDPVADLLHASPAECEQRALGRIREAAGLRYMLSAGCEVPAAVPDEVLRAFCEAPEKATASA
jgi:uroporphyrinogen-III decarboxylase